MRHNRMRSIAIRAVCRVVAALGIIGGLATGSTAGRAADTGSPTLSPDLAKARAALAKYQDPIAAVHDGYFSTLGCVEYANGGMGVHFINTNAISPVPDPMKPQILIYEPNGKKLRLVAAEWFVPLATGVKERPTLFGRPFDGPMAGHVPLMPDELHHYDLHVWLFKANPAGMFSPINPAVKCAGKTGYALMEEPPRTVPHTH